MWPKSLELEGQLQKGKRNCGWGRQRKVDLAKKKSFEGEVGHQGRIKRFTPTWKPTVLRVGLCWKPCGWRSKAKGTEVVLL